MDVFVDTSVLLRHQLGTDPTFGTFIERASELGARILQPEITKEELLRHARKQAEQAVAKLPGSAFLVSRFLDLPSRKELKDHCATAAATHVSELWGNLEVVPISSESGNLADVVRWYHDRAPPFSSGKKHEFPDAIVLSSLVAHQRATGKQLIIISGDDDFSRFCAGRSQFTFYSELSVLLREWGTGLTPAQERAVQLLLGKMEEAVLGFMEEIDILDTTFGGEIQEVIAEELCDLTWQPLRAVSTSSVDVFFSGRVRIATETSFYSTQEVPMDDLGDAPIGFATGKIRASFPVSGTVRVELAPLDTDGRVDIELLSLTPSAVECETTEFEREYEW